MDCKRGIFVVISEKRLLSVRADTKGGKWTSKTCETKFKCGVPVEAMKRRAEYTYSSNTVHNSWGTESRF
jgi:hypothetical protein